MRYLEKYIIEDLKEKMVFIGGPRQVGKTTFSLEIAKNYFPKYTYLNWDNLQHKKRILNTQYDFGTELIIFDEIHKYKKWKTFLKGEYDVEKERFKFLVTGSARLDIYQKGGDSMLGRYYYYRLHPFSLAEILGIKNDFSKNIKLHFQDKFYFEELKDLTIFGGFPEIFTKKNIRTLNRWKTDRLKRIIYEDIRDLNNLRDLGILELLASILPTKVASPFSINSLVEDLQVTNKTISHWIEIFEKVYFCYRIYPFTKNNLKSFKKEPKLYLWDYTSIENIGARNENIIANHLLKWVHFLQDVYAYDIKLQYLRDKEKREIDFVIILNGEVRYLIEVKTNDTSISKHLLYYKEKFLNSDCFQIVFGNNEVDIEKHSVRVISASKFLTGLV